MSETDPKTARRYVAADGSVDIRRLTHDLRAPLNGVLGFAKLLHNGKAGPLTDQQREFAADVLESGQALLKVVQQLEEEGRGSP
jgi:two-component system cell cycle sensor histidine kinase PleC